MWTREHTVNLYGNLSMAFGGTGFVITGSSAALRIPF